MGLLWMRLWHADPSWRRSVRVIRVGRVALPDSRVQFFGHDGDSIRQLEIGRLRRTQASDSDVALPLASCLSGMTLGASFNV